mmetsp:Transcript_3386/g.6177  ORF Transcript_3386/g.6177 Transcript_3386/m.6177 type:complete len:121 (-) Transcript_3386:228-590(-)
MHTTTSCHSMVQSALQTTSAWQFSVSIQYEIDKLHNEETKKLAKLLIVYITNFQDLFPKEMNRETSFLLQCKNSLMGAKSKPFYFCHALRYPCCESFVFQVFGYGVLRKGRPGSAVCAFG